MTEKDNHKIFTAADIRRYLNGEMSDTEMYALESAALEDPFLADAIEGFDQSVRQKNSNPDDDIEELHSRLRERIAGSERRRLPLFLRKNVAAILILLAGAGTMVYYLLEKNGRDRTYISQSESARSEINLQDSVSSTTDPQEDVRSGKLKSNTNPATSESEAMQQSGEAKTEDLQAPALARQSAPQPAKPQSGEAENKDNKFKKDIGYSSANKPGSGATSEARKNSALSTQVDRADTLNFDGKVRSDDSKAAMELSGTDPQNENKLRDSMPSRMMETANTTTSRSEKRAPQASSPASAEAAAAPVIGWKAYELYLKDNKKLPPSLKNIRGKVVLSFAIGQNGKPANFRVVKSLNKTMDQEAIRLVKEGPEWSATDSPVITTINF